MRNPSPSPSIRDRFSTGLNTREGAPRTSPRALENARVEQGDVVRASQEPTAVSPIAGDRPWIGFNDAVLTGGVSGVLAAETWMGRLIFAQGPGGASPQDRIKWLDASWTPPVPLQVGQGAGVHAEPAVCYGTHASQSTFFTDEGYADNLNTGISPGAKVTYLVIPVNRHQEAGPWRFIERGGYDDGTDDRYGIVGEVRCNAETSEVVVYRTLESRGIVDGAISNRFFTHGALRRGFFLLGRFQVERSGSSYLARFVDTRYWTVADFEAADSIPGIGPLTRGINLHSFEATGEATGFYRGPTAGAMYRAPGAMLYGDVRWPTKRPQIAQAVNTLPDGGWTRATVAVQYEYAHPSGPIYGPPLIGWQTRRQSGTYSQTGYLRATAFDVAWQGEAALLVWVYDPVEGEYVLLERLTPTSFLTYETQRYPAAVEHVQTLGVYQTPTFGQDKDVADLVAEARAKNPDEVGPYGDTARYVDAPALHFSGPNAPCEVTLDGARMPDERAPVVLLPTRLSKDENLRDYDLVAFTEGGVFAALAKDRQVAFTRVTQNRTLGVRRPEHACVTREGVAFIGTDGRLYDTDGRTIRPLDETVYRTWGEPLSVAYDSVEHDLYVATDDGVYVYEMDRREWVECRRPVDGFGQPVDVVEVYARPEVGRVQGQNAAETRALRFRPPAPGAEYDPVEGATCELQPIADDASGARLLAVSAYYDRREFTAATVEVRTPSPRDGTEAVDSFTAPPRRLRKINLSGAGHRLVIAGFETLRSVHVYAKQDESQP